MHTSHIASQETTVGISCHELCDYAYCQQADFGRCKVTMQVLDDTRVQPRHYKYAIDIAASAMNQADPGAGFMRTCCQVQLTHIDAKDCCGATLRGLPALSCFMLSATQSMPWSREVCQPQLRQSRIMQGPLSPLSANPNP